jgi:hypothetical protein
MNYWVTGWTVWTSFVIFWLFSTQSFICLHTLTLFQDVGLHKQNWYRVQDPYTLKILYNSFVRSHLDYASVVWNPYYGVHLKKIKAIQKKNLGFALRTLGWSHDIELPPYCQKCRLID